MVTDIASIIITVLAFITAFIAGWSLGANHERELYIAEKIDEWEREWKKFEEEEDLDFELD